MKISANEEYGLRCLITLAKHQGDTPLTLPDISRIEGLSLSHVSKIMGILRQAGLVESVRGRSGGYILPRSAEEINLSDIFRAIGGTLLETDYCEKHSGVMQNCVHTNACSIKGLWEVLQLHVDKLFRQLTLAELCRGQLWMQRRFTEQNSTQDTFNQKEGKII